MNQFYVVLFCLVLFPGFAIAQQNTEEFRLVAPEQVGMSAKRLALLDQHIKQFIDSNQLPGGVFLIARKGQIVYDKSFGHHTLAKKRPYQGNDIFRLASMTKAFTTVSILQLFERGQIGLDDPIHYYIPAFAESVVLEEYQAADTTYTTQAAKSPITVRHLLTHTSGITYGIFNPGKIQAIYTKLNAARFGLSHESMTTEEMVNQLAKLPLIFHPGEQYMYGLNMEILGRIVEVVSGKPLNKYFREHIFEPLGMEDTGFYFPAAKHDRIAPVYTYNRERQIIMASDTPNGPLMEYPKQKDNNHYAGGGGASGTAKDYARFIQALLDEGQYQGQRILSRRTIEMMTSDQFISLNRQGKGYSNTPGMTYGLGFALVEEEAQAVTSHSPGTFYWSGYMNTRFFVDPEEELIFVGMTQIVPFARPDFWDKLYAILYGAIEN